MRRAGSAQRLQRGGRRIPRSHQHRKLADNWSNLVIYWIGKYKKSEKRFCVNNSGRPMPLIRPAIAPPVYHPTRAEHPAAQPIYRAAPLAIAQAKAIPQRRPVSTAPPVYRPQSQSLAQAKMVQGINRVVQRVLRAGQSSAAEARLIEQYHAAENSGDSCSITSASADVHRTAIAHYQNARRLRRRAGAMHVNNDGGHLLAIATLGDKIAARNAAINRLEPPVAGPAPVAHAVGNVRVARPDWNVSMGTSSQASWLDGNQPAWFPRAHGT